MKIAVVGIGEHAQRNILPAIETIEDIELGYIFSNNLEITVQIAKKYGCIPCASLNELLDKNDVDAVYIATPVASHEYICEKVLISGKHVLVEKVAFPSLDAANKIYDLAKDKELVIFEGYMYLYHPQFIKLKEIINSGELGKIHSIKSTFGFPHLAKDNFRYNPSKGGGAILDAAGYTLSVSQNLISGDIKQFSASIGKESGYLIDTRGSAKYLHNNIDINCEWCFGADYKNQIEVWTEKGTVLVQRAYSKPECFDSIITVSNNGIVNKIKTGKANHFKLMLEQFKRQCDELDIESNKRIIEMARILDEVYNKAFYYSY